MLIKEEYQKAFHTLIGWYKGENNNFLMEMATETDSEAMDAMEIDSPSVTFHNSFKSLSQNITSKWMGFITFSNPGIGKQSHLSNGLIHI